MRFMHSLLGSPGTSEALFTQQQSEDGTGITTNSGHSSHEPGSAILTLCYGSLDPNTLVHLDRLMDHVIPQTSGRQIIHSRHHYGTLNREESGAEQVQVLNIWSRPDHNFTTDAPSGPTGPTTLAFIPKPKLYGLSCCALFKFQVSNRKEIGPGAYIV